ncbi:MAG: hypothetical protein R2991_00975 [Thermoanaerobaculia bacterium]
MPEPSPLLPVRAVRALADGGAEVTVGLGEALFEGHFPGHPTLSAIGQLAVVEAALEAWSGKAKPVASVGRMRLSRRVEGGEVTVRLAGDGEGARFSLVAGGETASSGTVGVRAGGPSGRPGPAGTGAGRFRPGGGAGSEVVLPHAGVARMLAGGIEAEGERVVAEAVLGEESPFAGLGRRDGQAPAWVGIEMAAQAAAALEIVQGAGSDGGGRLGYLVRLREIRCRCDALPVGTPVRLEVVRGAAVATLRSYEARALVEGAELLTGELSVFFEPAG